MQGGETFRRVGVWACSEVRLLFETAVITKRSKDPDEVDNVFQQTPTRRDDSLSVPFTFSICDSNLFWQRGEVSQSWRVASQEIRRIFVASFAAVWVLPTFYF